MAKKKTKARSKTTAKPKRSAARTKARKTKKAVLKSKPRPAARKAVAKKTVPRPQPARSKAIAAGYQWINAALVVREMKPAIDFYTAAFGFRLRSAMPGPDGKLMHAELMHHESVLMLGPENQQMGSFAPQGPGSITLYIYVENVDQVMQRAAGLGGKIMMPASDMFWGDRCGVVVDPEGHSWMVATHFKDRTPEEMMQAMKSSMPAGPPPPIM